MANDIANDDVSSSCLKSRTANFINFIINEAQGSDNIQARLLKETAAETAISLCALFNKSLYVLVFSGLDDWENCMGKWNVVLVYKRGVKTHVENYRLVS